LNTAIWPLVLYFLAVLALVVILIGRAYLLGERHRERVTGEPYESGMPVTGTAQVRMNVGFYLIAVFFVIFDLEALFIFAWAVALREAGWPGFTAMVIFIALLLAALVYLAKAGALEPGKADRGDLRKPRVS
jgi:NADH-quinone oxidoreductase subunit A